MRKGGKGDLLEFTPKFKPQKMYDLGVILRGQNDLVLGLVSVMGGIFRI